MAREYARSKDLVILCGHYEGVDERVLEATGAETITQIKQDMVGSLANMKKCMDGIPKEDRDVLWAIVAKLMKMGGENVWQEAKRGLNAVLESVAAREKEKKPELPES